MTDWSVIVNARRAHRLSHPRYRKICCPIRQCEKPTGRANARPMTGSADEAIPPTLSTVDKSLLAKIVILRESGVSSTLRILDSIIAASEYWIARFRGR